MTSTPLGSLKRYLRVLVLMVFGCVLAGFSPVYAAAETFPIVDGDKQATIVGYGHFLAKIIEASTGARLKVIMPSNYSPECFLKPRFKESS